MMSSHTLKRYSREEFDEEFNKLDFDCNHLVTMKELSEHGFDRRDKQEHLAIAIIWIGHSLCPEYSREKIIIDKLIAHD